MRMKTLFAAISGAIIFGAATLSPAQTTGSSAGASPAKKETTAIGTGTTPGTIDTSKPGSAEKRTKTPRLGALDQWEAERDRIESAHKVANEKCDVMKGNAKDICKAEAKADMKVAKAELEVKRKGTPDKEYDLKVAKANAEYEVAKEKCEDQKGEEQRACKKQAKADERKAIAEAKKSKKVASAKGSTERKAKNGGTTNGAADSSRDSSISGGKEATTKGAQTSDMMKPDGGSSNVQTTQSGTESTSGKKY